MKKTRELQRARTNVVDAAGRELWIEALSAERLQVVDQEGPQMEHVVPVVQRKLLYMYRTRIQSREVHMLRR